MVLISVPAAHPSGKVEVALEFVDETIGGVTGLSLLRPSGLRLSTAMVVPGPPIQPIVGMFARTLWHPGPPGS